MILKFKNADIFFAVESIWDKLNYKFRTLLNLLVTANADPEFVQEFDIPAQTLVQIFATVNTQPEGVAASTNKEMLTVLIPQLMAASNMDEVNNQPASDHSQQSMDAPDNRIHYNEAAQILIAIAGIEAANDSVLAAKLLSGKTQILA